LLLPSGARASALVAGPVGLRRGFVPRGPVPATAAAVMELVDWARDAGLVRLRVEPEARPELGPDLLSLGFRPAPAMHPKDTQLVPLGEPDAMLAGFKPKHRYNVRLAERRGVRVEATGDVAELHRQHLATADRQEISAPSVGHYERRLRQLAWCRVYVARIDEEAIAAIMVARFGARAYYLFGGSSGAHRNLMPTYAVQWAAMREAAAAGCRHYDLWGLPPSAEPGHPWHGLWQFKTGFGGEHVTYAGAFDLTLRPLRARLASVPLPGLARIRRLTG
ncbi:MAG: peptidoglycan bridge formation glycyltransferase FemA/FemB family protein, partial [Candidatus Dormiibacterota bacterium]